MKARGIALLGVVVLVCLLLLTVQTRGYSSTASDAVAKITTPVQVVLARVNRGAFGLWATYLDWKNVRAENKHLRDDNQRLRVDALRIGETVDENRRLRRLLELREQMPMATVPGEVIAREWGGWVRSLTVNRGREDHIVRLTAVLSPEGLIGRVIDVRAGASVVHGLTD